MTLPTIQAVAAMSAGVSTSHYLFINGAVASVIEEPSKALELSLGLRDIPGHADIVDQCQFPAEEDPRRFLLRVTQSTPYQYLMLQRPDVGNAVLERLRRISGVEPDVNLTLHPDRTPSRIHTPPNVLRVLTQIDLALHHYAEFAHLPEPPAGFENHLDIFQPSLHWLLGALMVIETLKTNGKKQFLDETREGISFALFVGNRLIGIFSRSFPWLAPTILDLRSGVMIDPEKEPTSTLLQHDQFMVFAGVLFGIDEGLQLMVSELSELGGINAPLLAMHVEEGRQTNIAPVTEKIKRILSNDTPPPQA